MEELMQEIITELAQSTKYTQHDVYLRQLLQGLDVKKCGPQPYQKDFGRQLLSSAMKKTL